MAGALAIGVSTNDLGVVLAFNVSSMRLLASLEFNPLSFFSLPLPPSLSHAHAQGCFTAVPLAFILPTASYLKLSKTPWFSRGKIAAVLVVLFGLIVMMLGTIQATIQVHKATAVLVKKGIL